MVGYRKPWYQRGCLIVYRCLICGFFGGCAWFSNTPAIGNWVPGLVLSMLTETLIVGATTGFNPAFMAATAGSELLTDVPFWWCEAFIGGWAFRPVRVETSAFDPLDGAVVWNETEAVVYLWGRLKEVPEGERKKKEVQLGLNLSKECEEEHSTSRSVLILVSHQRGSPHFPVLDVLKVVRIDGNH